MNQIGFLWRYFRRYGIWCVGAFVAVALFAVCTTALTGLFEPLFTDVLRVGSTAAGGTGKAVAALAAGAKSAGVHLNPKLLIDDGYHWLVTRFGIDRTNVAIFLPLVFLAVFALRGLFDFLGTYAFQRIGLGATTDIRNDLFDRIVAQSSRFHSQHSSGELVSRVINDVTQMQNAVSTGLLDLVQQGMTLIALIVMLFASNYRLALLFLIAAPVLALPIIRFGQGMRRSGRRSQERLADLSALVAEAARGHRVVKSFGMEEFEGGRFRAATRRHLLVNLWAQFLAALSGPVVEVLGVAGASALMIYAGESIRDGKISAASVFSFLAIVGMMYNPMRRLNKVNLVLQQSLAASQRVMDLMVLVPEIAERPDARPLAAFRERVRYEDVTFAYEREPVVRGLDLELRRGELLALVGPSGAGKSTVVNLLPRFFDPSAGRITIDGVDIREVRLRDLRALIGLVTQETMLFDETVRNNIAYGRADLPLERVREAAAAAYADNFIQELPDGYDTMLGEAGLRLSGGQRQRLAIARAILKDAPILILDEATSQLDAESESLVQKALHNLMQGRTTLVIAHRLATVVRADRILVMDEGRIVEQGTHQQLLAADGLYRRLYDLQFRDVEAAPEEP